MRWEMKRPPRGATTRVLHKLRGSYLLLSVHSGHRNRVTKEPGTRSRWIPGDLDQSPPMLLSFFFLFILGFLSSIHDVLFAR